MAETSTSGTEPKPSKPPYEQSGAELAKSKQASYDADKERLAEEHKAKG
jgi:hypothetical protein